MGFMARELNLTDAQKAQVKTIMQANHANMKTGHAAVGAEPRGPAGGNRQWRL